MARNIQDLPQKTSLIGNDQIIGLDAASADRGIIFTISDLSTRVSTLIDAATSFGNTSTDVSVWAQGSDTSLIPISKIPTIPSTRISDFSSAVANEISGSVVTTTGNQTIDDVKNFTALRSNGSPVLSQQDLEINTVTTIPVAFEWYGRSTLGISELTASVANLSGVTGVAEVGGGYVVQSLIAIEENFNQVLQVADITRFRVTNTTTNAIFDFTAQPGYRGVFVLASASTDFYLGFDTEANKDAFATAWVSYRGGVVSPNLQWELQYNRTNASGEFAEVTNSLHLQNGLITEGPTELETLGVSGCVELFNRASNVYNPSTPTGGTLLGTLNSDLRINSTTSIGDIVVLSSSLSTPIDATSVPEGAYIYFTGFPHAGVIRRASFGALPVGGWGPALGTNYGDQFTNGLPEVIPSGTEVRWFNNSSDLELVGFDAQLGLLVEPDLCQISTEQIRTPNLPTSVPAGEGYWYTQTGTQLGLTGAAASLKFLIQS